MLDRNTFPMFKTYQEADAYANVAYYDEIANGEEIDIFKTGRKDNKKYVVGMLDDRKQKKLPKGYRWKLVVL